MIDNNPTQTNKKDTAREKYNELVKKFVSDLEQGVEPWKKSWNLKNGLPQSATTNGLYSGINIISLMSENQFQSNKWITAKQVEKLGGTIKEKELENPKDIFFLKNMEKVHEELNEETGEIEQKKETYKILRNYKVWNTEQVDGINFQHEEPKSDNEKVQKIEEFLKSINPIILRGEPAYSKQGDCIYMPHISDFEDSENYYSAFFHELSHWTNHDTRIDRDKFLQKYKEKAYGIEELIAEMSSAFLCAEKGISMETTQHSEYLDGWVKNIKENPYILFSASSQASKATSYLERLSANNIKQSQDKKQTKSKSKFARPKAS